MCATTRDNGEHLVDKLAAVMNKVDSVKLVLQENVQVALANCVTLDNIDLIELNEAFAVQSLGVMRELGIDPAITNVNGGAIALGHPLGCSGARILTTLLYEMQRRAEAGEAMRYGLATLCVGVGQGEATVIELL